MIKLDNITKQYHYSTDTVLDNVSLHLDYGINTLLVDTQSGKTTIAKLLLGLELPDSGTVAVLGNQKTALHDIALLDSKLLLFEKRTVLYNLMYPLIVRGVDKSTARAKALDVAEQFGMTDIVKCRVNKLQHNKKIELCVARATMRKVQLAIIDNLDAVCSSEQWQWVADNITTHCNNVLLLTSNINSAIGHTTILHNNIVIYSGDSDKASKVLEGQWLLYNRVGEGQ